MADSNILRIDFYPRPPRGGRQVRAAIMDGLRKFLSTPSARRATAAPVRMASFMAYFYPRPPRGGRLVMQFAALPGAGISIHALREEGDCARGEPKIQNGNFYPRPPRGGRLTKPYTRSIIDAISIHALREEGDNRGAVHDVDFQKFLSTPSARRATLVNTRCSPRSTNFYPRPPRGGRQRPVGREHRGQRISIHALREEGDHRTGSL